jgi:hypothetical protein
VYKETVQQQYLYGQMTEFKEIPVVKNGLEKQVVQPEEYRYFLKFSSTVTSYYFIPRTMIPEKRVIESPVTHYQATQPYEKQEECDGTHNTPLLCPVIAKMPE